MAIFSSPSLRTVGIILSDIYGQNVAREEFRFYEVYNMVFTQIAQALEGKGQMAPHIRDEIAIAPQYSLKREALSEPIDLYGFQEDLSKRLALKGLVIADTARSDADELEEAENYLAEASMEVHYSDEEIDKAIRDVHDIDDLDENSSQEANIETEYRIPDLLVSHITSLRGRRTLLFIEIKPDVPLTQTDLVELHDQAKLQASFAFEIFPAERIIFSLMIIGRKFYLKKFDKDFCTIRHHLLTKVDEEPYSPHNNTEHGKRKDPEVTPNMWGNIFRETLKKSGDQITNVEIRGFSMGFKKAMNRVMTSMEVGKIQWGNC